MVEIKAYYVEARLYEIEQMRERALCARSAQADNKGFQKFQQSLDKTIDELKAEVQSEKVREYNMRSSADAKHFFGSISKLIATANKRG